MRTTKYTDTGLHVTYELEDYLGEMDDKEHRRQKRVKSPRRLHTERIVVCVYVGAAIGCGLVFSLYRAYLYLFPQR